MRSLPPLSAVRVFESAARHENFTKAAAELGMTQAAVSYQIRLLEERLGSPLFYRTKGRLTLTEAGRRASPLASDAFDTLDRAFRLVRTENENILTISTVQSLATNWLAPRIGAFQVSRPQLAVRLRTDDHHVDFAAEDVDAAIRLVGRPESNLAAHFLIRSAMQPFASPDFVARHGPIRTAEDILGLSRLTPDDIWWEQWFCRVSGASPPPSAKPGVRLDSQLMEAQAAIGGHGIAILNAVLWRHEVAAGRLVPVGEMVPGDRAFWLVYPEHRRNAPKIRAFRNWLQGEMDILRQTEPTNLFQPPEV